MEMIHDPLCRMATGISEVFCDCALIARVVERERGWQMPPGNPLGDAEYLYGAIDHAEQVAARLVEVICEMDEEQAGWIEAAYRYKSQRDAARAEVADLRAKVDGLTQYAAADDGRWCVSTEDVLALLNGGNL